MKPFNYVEENPKPTQQDLNEAFYVKLISGDFDIAKELVQAGADVTYNRDIAIIVACTHKNRRNTYNTDFEYKESILDYIKFFYDYGASVTSNYNQAIREAMYLEDDRIIEYLLDKGAVLPSSSTLISMMWNNSKPRFILKCMNKYYHELIPMNIYEHYLSSDYCNNKVAREVVSDLLEYKVPVTVVSREFVKSTKLLKHILSIGMELPKVNLDYVFENAEDAEGLRLFGVLKDDAFKICTLTMYSTKNDFFTQFLPYVSKKELNDLLYSFCNTYGSDLMTLAEYSSEFDDKDFNILKTLINTGARSANIVRLMCVAVTCKDDKLIKYLDSIISVNMEWKI